MCPEGLGGSGRTAPDDSTALVHRAQIGDVAAWEELYLRHHDAILFAVRARLGAGLRERVTSEDILQSVVADALSDIRRFEPRGEGSFGRWLSACVLNKIRSKAEHFGADKRSGGVPLSDSLAGRLAAPADETPRYADPERWEVLEATLAELEPEQREVVLLRTIEGLSNVEAAARIHKSPEAASKLYNRALARVGARIAARGKRASLP
jgi:RNA polymerase sigma-70 factor (ECF subfamily)